MKNPFYNHKEKRIRAGWRIVICVFLIQLMGAAIFFIKPLLGDITKKEFLEVYSIIVVAVLAISATIAVALCRRYLDKASFISLGLRFSKKTWKDLLFGFFLSGLMVLSFFGLVTAFDLVEYNGLNLHGMGDSESGSFSYVSFIKTATVASLFIFLLEHILVGYWEELAFRGYLLQNMMEGMGLRLAIVISCLLYGLIHWMNPNAGILSSAIIVLFGFLRIYGFLSTKMLWLSMGMHIGWNFFQGPIFGFAASGHETATLIDLKITGEAWLSGGAFGPEGSVLIIPIIILALFAMRWWAKGESVKLENDSAAVQHKLIKVHQESLN